VAEEDIKASLPYADPRKAIFDGDGWDTMGTSVLGHPIKMKHLKGKPGGVNILLIGGVHGNETEGVRFMEEFTREFALNGDTSFNDANLFIVPVMNPDGFLNFIRGNGNKVDLNRNMPTKDWTTEHSEEKYFPGKSPSSEPETGVLIDILEKVKPVFIVSFHSWKPMININGPARAYAEVMEKKIAMPIVEDIGYPTPGSLGTYAGWEREIPTITLEFERGVELDTIYPSSREAIIDTLNFAASLQRN